MPELSAVNQKWALITGGSRGLGYAFARECIRKGYHLFLISKTEERLRRAAESLRSEGDRRVEILPLDLAQEGSASLLSKILNEKKITPRVWINNAGSAHFERFTRTTPEEASEIVRLNVLSLTAMTRLALEIMARGHLINVASTAAFTPGPGAALYYASKSFVMDLTLAVSFENAKSPVKVSLLCPGPLDTDMLSQRGEKGRRAAFLVMSPEKTARYALKKALKGKIVIIPGISNKIMAAAARILPRGWIVRLIGRSNLR